MTEQDPYNTADSARWRKLELPDDHTAAPDHFEAQRYLGEPGGRVDRVAADGRRAPLPDRRDLRAHSQAGFEWGYGGSGPAQLAIAILADAAGDQAGQGFYQEFKWDVVAKLPRGEPFVIEARDVRAWLGARLAAKAES